MHELDLDWFRTHLLDDLLPRWLRAAVTPEGLFLPQLDRSWNRQDADHGTLVSQSRLLFNFATGYALAGEPAYRQEVESGARFLLERFGDREHGGFYWSCGLDGAPRDTRKDAYGHAFAVFGLSHAFAATGDPAYRDGARRAWDTLRGRFADGNGGLVPGFARAWTQAAERRSQNPVMHYFEALLALAREGRSPDAREEAARVAGFVLERMRPEDGALPELYDAGWQPLSSVEGGRIEIGHQFEWAWLLSQGVAQGLPAQLLAPAARLLDFGMRAGYDAELGGIFSAVTPEGVLLSHGKGWWEQCEAARAMLRFVYAHGRDDLQEPLATTLAFMRARLLDPEHGGWYMRVEPDGRIPNHDKGSTWKVDYHVIGLCREAMERGVSGAQFEP